MINVSAVSEIVTAMKNAMSAHRSEFSSGEICTLRELTRKLIAAKPEALDEYARFLSIRDRGLSLPTNQLRDRLGGAVVMVTGGTGCIGSELMAQIARFRPARLVSISRGITVNWPAQAMAEYMIGDVRDQGRMNEIVAKVHPDVIFHVVAQRSPALAEVEVYRTVTTNIFGSRNILETAIANNVPQVVLASTGKALRPYSPEIYTASKRAAEWNAAHACGEILVSAARFTHVINNSIGHNRMRDDAVIRLHSPEIAFYVQSALESAQLLLIACADAKLDEFRIHAITDLGWPVSLLDVAIGVASQRPDNPPIYISGYDPGYEEVSFPGLYDQATAGDVSPLFNAFETANMVCPQFPMVDAFDLDMAYQYRSRDCLAALEDVCNHSEDPAMIRSMLDHLSWSILDDTLAAVPQPVLKRTVAILDRHFRPMNETHVRIAKAIRGYAG